MQLSDYAQALGAAQRLVPNFQDQEQQAAQTRVLQMQPQLIQQQIAASQQNTQLEAQKAAYQDQRRSAFTGALAGLGAKPTPDKLYALGVQFPEFAQTINQAAKGVDESRRMATVRQLAPIQAYIQNGKYDQAAADVKRHIDADIAAGNPPDETDQELYAELTSGDATRQKAAGGVVYGLLAAVNPDTAAANIQKRQDSNTHVVSQGGALVGDDGTVLYQAGTNPEYRTVKNADGSESIVQIGGSKGGDPVSGGGAANGSAAPAGRTQYGWTPRARNGGDNSDAAVDSKIAGMSKALGIDPNAPLDGLSNMQIAKALTLSEGGAGSIADRNNNPGNLRDPKTGAYRSFPTKQAGLEAAASQVARNRARGQNTIRTMVEGVPVGGSAPRAAGGGAQVVYTSNTDPGASGAKLDDATIATMAQQYLAGDPSVMTNLGRGKQGAENIVRLRAAIAQQAAAQGMSGAQIAAQMQNFKMHQQGLNAFAKGPEARTVRSLNVTIDHLDTLQNAAQALQNGNIRIFNKVGNAWARATGRAAPTNFEAVKQIVSTEVAKAIVGGQTALGDRKDIADGISGANSPQQLAGWIAEAKKLLGGQLDGLAGQYKTATGRDDFKDRLSPRTRRALGYDRPAAPGGFRIVSRRPK